MEEKHFHWSLSMLKKISEGAILYKCDPASIRNYVHFSESFQIHQDLWDAKYKMFIFTDSPNYVSCYAVAASLVEGKTVFSSSFTVTSHLILCNGQCLLFIPSPLICSLLSHTYCLLTSKTIALLLTKLWDNFEIQ